MDKKEEIIEVQSTILEILPYWNYKISKPFKMLLDEGITSEMYYFLCILRYNGGSGTMSEVASWVKMQKQQMTKVVNRLVEANLVTRMYDAKDRRSIVIRITDKAIHYIDDFLNNNETCFRNMLENMSEDKLSSLHQALLVLYDLLSDSTVE